MLTVIGSLSQLFSTPLLFSIWQGKPGQGFTAGTFSRSEEILISLTTRTKLKAPFISEVQCFGSPLPRAYLRQNIWYKEFRVYGGGGGVFPICCCQRGNYLWWYSEGWSPKSLIWCLVGRRKCLSMIIRLKALSFCYTIFVTRLGRNNNSKRETSCKCFIFQFLTLCMNYIAVPRLSVIWVVRSSSWATNYFAWVLCPKLYFSKF